MRHFGAEDRSRAEIPGRVVEKLDAACVMEGHLASRPFFVNERYSIADIALYAYTHVAPEGGLELTPYPKVRAWIERVASQPHHIPLQQVPSGAPAAA